MYDKDYLMRELALHAQALANLIRLVTGGHHQDAMTMIDEQLEDTLKMSSGLAKNLSPASLLNLLHIGGQMELEQERGVYVAALFEQAARIYAQQNQPDQAYHCRMSALHLLLHFSAEKPLPPYAPSIENLLEDHLPAETMHLLFGYYERQGDYGKAEDTLFDLLDTDHSQELIEDGIAFYKRLNTLPDGQLEAGNLPREELVEGLAYLYELEED